MIYFIREKGTDNCKIGYSEESLEKRLSQLQTGNSKELEIVFGLPGGRERESQLHKTYESKKLRGEWFQLDKEILLSILSVSFGTEIKQKGLLERIKQKIGYEKISKEQTEIKLLESIGIMNVPDEQQIEVEENEYDKAIDAVADFKLYTKDNYTSVYSPKYFKVQVTIVDEIPSFAYIWDEGRGEGERLRIENWDEEREYYEKERKEVQLALRGLMYGHFLVYVWFKTPKKERTLQQKNKKLCLNIIKLPAKGSTIWGYAEVLYDLKGLKLRDVYGCFQKQFGTFDSKVELSINK